MGSDWAVEALFVEDFIALLAGYFLGTDPAKDDVRESVYKPRVLLKHIPSRS